MKRILLIAFVLLFLTPKTYAVRPFVTKDATIGHRLWQLETWALFDKYSAQHWNMLTYGVSDEFEVSAGLVWGKSNSTFATPLIETKYLFREYQAGKSAGVAIAAGAFLPTGKDNFIVPGNGAYSLLAITACLGENENIFVHANIGATYLNVENRNSFAAIWRLGAQVKVFEDLHFVGEILAGGPFVPGTGVACHAGFKYSISERIQIDASIGQGNKTPLWAGFGARFVIKCKS